MRTLSSTGDGEPTPCMCRGRFLDIVGLDFGISGRNLPQSDRDCDRIVTAGAAGLWHVAVACGLRYLLNQDERASWHVAPPVNHLSVARMELKFLFDLASRQLF
jgi:hypothetical protein